MTLGRTLTGLGAAAVLVGAWGLFDRITQGHHNAAYGSYVVWGLWVAMYLFFAGLAAGAFMVATLDLLFEVKTFRGTGRIALWVAVVSLGAALAQVWLDLGHMDRIWKVYLQGNPGSVMAQMVWGYTVFGALLVVALALAVRRPGSPALRAAMIAGLPLSLFVSGAVGALLGVQASRQFWHVGLFPVQFPVFSLATGVAAVMVAIGLFGPRDAPQRGDQLWALAVATIVLAAVKLYFLWADFSQSLYGNVPQNVAAVHAVLYGPYWWTFWIGQLLVGTFVPVAVLVQRRLARHPVWAGWMGVLVLVGLAVARANIVFPALAVPELEALTTAFSGPHLAFDYFPSAMEWAVTAGTVGLALLVFVAGSRVLMQQEEVA
ncbi:MAG: NrfD/PsrC family molybdoenzyme membrane anchor subunit [Armatimonadota bacterium]|nr:NrfD/PsrC family molybdoenzyme membrane anchor subunit [Armatimonadota bacterium]MDR7423318.1 NrfD/PsrC family molybdoenzyme membrane anchor subunit [Armatimonadota bacterium]MDR7455348.1 NrfD/PsrC family molybdoenzyme membrane anchor subunit [Armatimonadota bacterium]MDR7457059.1 NrfD/PsrC family molybdoenzyme membrane anchor subunit [Armatimonadota bacterium]MDR7511927.1 NrfD/PsrC family molybdoenzyme membrane anchor subunit [Armatimonadota bacterium]